MTQPWQTYGAVRHSIAWTAWRPIGEAMKRQMLSEAACDWLIGRSLNPATCHKLGVRSVTRAEWAYLRERCADYQLRASGILHDGKYGEYMHPPYDEWLLLPMETRQGHWASARHRTIGNDKVKCMSAVGSQDKPLPFLANHIDDKHPTGRVLIVEGETDALSLWHVGEQAVASPGVYWPWVRWTLERLVAGLNVIVVGDGDRAGKQFANLVSEVSRDIDVRTWPAGYDANDLLREGRL